MPFRQACQSASVREDSGRRAQQTLAGQKCQQHRQRRQIVDVLAPPGSSQDPQQREQRQLPAGNTLPAQIPPDQQKHGEQFRPGGPGRAEGLHIVQKHRRQQERDVQDGEPAGGRRFLHALAGQGLGRRQEAAHRTGDEQRLDQHDPAGKRQEHQAENEHRAGEKMLPGICFQRARLLQNGQVVGAPASRPDDEQHHQRDEQIRQHPAQPAHREGVPAADLSCQRDSAVHHRKSQQHKQPFVDEERRGAPVVAKKQPVGGKRHQAPEDRRGSFRRQAFSGSQHTVSPLWYGAHSSASNPAARAGCSAARYSSGVPKGRCRSVAKLRICAPRSASTL